MSAVATAASLAGVTLIAVRAGDKPAVLASADRAGRVVVIDARNTPDPGRWPAAIAAIRAASIVVTVRSPDAAIGRYAAEMGKAGDSVLIIACAEGDARAWRVLVAANQRDIGGFGQATRSAA